MKSMKQILAILVCLSFYAQLGVAQETQLAKPSRDTTSRDVTIIIQQRQLRFSAPATVQELRLEVFNQAGETVYDSGIITGQELSWALQNASGEAVPSGLYAYTLTIKDSNSESPALRRGHLILESGRDRLWVTNQGAIGAEAAMSGGELTVSSGPETSVAGARIGRAVSARSTPNLDFFGTPGRIPMFTGSDFLADSIINQDFNGRIGIGTTRPGTALLTVAGQIETTSGGIKFPNGTVQTTSAAGSLFQALHNATLTGNGTEASPLGVAVPLSLNGSTGGGTILQIVNADGRGLGVTGGGSGSGVIAIGGNNNSVAGNGLQSQGGSGVIGGIRQDAYANKYRIQVEDEKSERERGYYLHPKLFDQPEEKSIEWARNPEMMRQIKRPRQEAELRSLEKKNDR